MKKHIEFVLSVRWDMDCSGSGKSKLRIPGRSNNLDPCSECLNKTTNGVTTYKVQVLIAVIPFIKDSSHSKTRQIALYPGTAHNPPASNHTPYPPLPSSARTPNAWTQKLKHILPTSFNCIHNQFLQDAPQEQTQKKHKNGAKRNKNSFSTLIDKDGDVIMSNNHDATVTPNIPMKHAPPSLSKSPPLCRKLRNAKAKSKSTNKDLANAILDDLMIKDPLQLPPSNTSPNWTPF
eukprot:scaffold31886_cov66-Attheya_sp.AAC.5